MGAGALRNAHPATMSCTRRIMTAERISSETGSDGLTSITICATNFVKQSVLVLATTELPQLLTSSLVYRLTYNGDVVASENGPPARREEGAYLNRYASTATGTAVDATLAAASWHYLPRCSLRPVLIQIWALGWPLKNSQLTCGDIGILSSSHWRNQMDAPGRKGFTFTSVKNLMRFMRHRQLYWLSILCAAGSTLTLASVPQEQKYQRANPRSGGTNSPGY